MDEFLTYHLESAIVLALIYLVYRAFLRNETFFTLNRFVLLGSLPLAFTLPLLDISVGSSTVNATAQAFTMPVVNATEVSVQATAEESSIPILLYVYLGGMALFLIHALYGLFSIFRLKKKATKQERNEDTIYLVDKGHSFSFFRMIFLNREHHSPKDLEQIKAHEQIHVRQYHSVDALLIHLAIIFQWFNPFVWLLKYAIYENHEYIADRETSRRATNFKYQDLMLKQAAGIPLSTLVHPFNKLSLKRRFKMLLKNQSNKRNLLKYLLLLPVAGVLFWGISCSNDLYKNQPEGNKSWAENLADSLIKAEKNIPPYNRGHIQWFEPKGINIDDKKVLENRPKFKEGTDSHMEYLREQIDYPPKAKEDSIEGTVWATFEVEKDGSVTNIKLVREIGHGFDKKVKKALENMPDWEPGHFEGEPITYQFLYPVHFSLENQSGQSNSKKEAKRDDKVFVVVEQQPRYPGGEKARKQYLAENITYPEKAQEKGIEGTVYVSFIVEKDGSITDVRVLKGIGGGCDNEAIRVVKDMPKWEPGKQRGEPVRVRFQMPLRFSLSDDSEEQ